MKIKKSIKFIFLVVICYPLVLQGQTADSSKISKAFFDEFTQKLNDSIPSLGSFIIYWNEKVIYEKYFHGADNKSEFNIKSVTKSVVSALAGIAKDKNLLPDLNTPVLKILSEYNRSREKFPYVWFKNNKRINDSIRSTITLRDLLTMQSGFEWSESGVIARTMCGSSDPVQFTLDLPFEDYPGTKFNYNTGVTIIFGAALAKIVNTSLINFAQENLFKPLNIEVKRWDTDPLNRNIGGSELYMLPNDMGKFGLLFLHKGNIGNKQIISQSWIEESTSEQTKLDFWDVMPNADGYGYYWWRRKTNGNQAYIASGYGGQLICVIPDLQMVIVTTCFLNEQNRGRQEINKLHNFIDVITERASR